MLLKVDYCFVTFNLTFFQHLFYCPVLRIGGLSTKNLYSKIFQWKTTNKIDVVTGDGELIVVDIVNHNVKESPREKRKGRRFFMVDSTSKYEVKDISGVKLDRSFLLNEPVDHKLGFLEANIVTSRGCVYNCTFCAAARSLNKNYSIRERSVISIKKELQEIRRNYPKVTSIRVLDDLFLKSFRCVEKATKVFSEFDFQWRSMAHVMTFKNVDSSMLQSLKESGCYELFIGIESGSPRILSSIKKTRNLTTIISNLTKVLEAGIHIKGYFIYGFPTETEEDMEMTFELACKLKEIADINNTNFRTSVFQYRPYHGTQIYHDLEAEGFNLKVNRVKPNHTLSNKVGRLQFNFHSGNYSQVENNKLIDYIYRTTKLNDGKLFAGLEQRISATQEEVL